MENQVLYWLGCLAGLSPDPLMPFYERYSDPVVNSSMTQIREAALTALSFLRCEAPQELVVPIQEKVKNPKELKNAFALLARTVGSGEGDRKDFLTFLMDDLRRRVEHNKHAGQKNQPRQPMALPLWAVATALWSHPEFCFTLQNQSHVPFIFQRAAQVLNYLANVFEKSEHKKMDEKKINGMLYQFRSANEILLGLLRLRGREGGDFFRAGTARMVQLADQITILDACFWRYGKRCTSKLQFELPDSFKQEGQSELTSVLVSLLRGSEGASFIKIVDIDDG